MFRQVRAVVVFLLVAACIVAGSGCAGTRSTHELSSDPVMIKKDIAELEMDIRNTEEMYKASLTELQMEEDATLRREVNDLWIELEYLRSQKAALEERLAELEAKDKR
jgi:outer membrane murein-binding lipoprotein Lpp